jgi:hypothetical protein
LNDFFNELGKTSSTVYNTMHGDKRNLQKSVISVYRKCYHNVRKRTKSGKQGDNEILTIPETAGK